MAALIIALAEPAASGQHFDLRSACDEVLDRVEHIDHVLAVCSDHGGAYSGPAMQIEVVNLGSGDLKRATQVGDDGPHDRAFRLQRMHVAQQEVEFDPADPHSSSQSEANMRGGQIAVVDDERGAVPG